MWGVRRVLYILCCGTILLAGSELALAQQPDATKFNQNYETALANARQECAALRGDHVFDPLRAKIAFGETKPTFSMLTNSERVRPKDKPLADLAIKANEKCRQAYSAAFALLPSQTNNLMDGLYRSQDALIAEL
jgi:hypothetical protein